MSLEILINKIRTSNIKLGQIYYTFGSPFLPDTTINIINVELCQDCPIKTHKHKICQHHLNNNNLRDIDVGPYLISYVYKHYDRWDEEIYYRCIEAFYRTPPAVQLRL